MVIWERLALTGSWFSITHSRILNRLKSSLYNFLLVSSAVINASWNLNLTDRIIKRRQNRVRKVKSNFFSDQTPWCLTKQACLNTQIASLVMLSHSEPRLFFFLKELYIFVCGATSVLSVTVSFLLDNRELLAGLQSFSFFFPYPSPFSLDFALLWLASPWFIWLQLLPLSWNKLTFLSDTLCIFLHKDI